MTNTCLTATRNDIETSRKTTLSRVSDADGASDSGDASDGGGGGVCRGRLPAFPSPGVGVRSGGPLGAGGGGRPAAGRRPPGEPVWPPAQELSSRETWPAAACPEKPMELAGLGGWRCGEHL